MRQATQIKSCRAKKPRLAPLDIRALSTTGATPVHDPRIAHCGSAGVVVFKVGEGERVLSFAHLPEGDA